MTNDFMSSNLSKIKPQFRTRGNVTGNFGMPKVKGANNNNLGETAADSITITHPDDYLARMYAAFDKTDDPHMQQFIYQEIRKILIQRGLWEQN